jgi:hypothetical protein
MLNINRRKNEKDAFDIIGRFSDVSANKALLDAVGHLPSARLYTGGIRSGNSTALSHFVWSLERNDYPPLTYCECSDYWLRCLNLAQQMLRAKDAVESMTLPLSSERGDRDEILYVGKDIPLLESYDAFEFKAIIDGETYELDAHVSVFQVLERMAAFARLPRSAS